MDTRGRGSGQMDGRHHRSQPQPWQLQLTKTVQIHYTITPLQHYTITALQLPGQWPVQSSTRGVEVWAYTCGRLQNIIFPNLP